MKQIELKPYNETAMKLFLSVLVCKYNIKFFAIALAKGWFKQGYEALKDGLEVSPEMINLIVATYNKTFELVSIKHN